MKMTVGAVLAALLLALPIAAQRPGPGSPGGPGRGQVRGVGGAPPIDRVIGIVLERRDLLRLSGEQVQQLEALRTDIQEENTDLRDQMQELREEVARDRGTVRERMEDFRAKARELRDGQQGRLEDILSQDQRDRPNEHAARNAPIAADECAISRTRGRTGEHVSAGHHPPHDAGCGHRLRSTPSQRDSDVWGGHGTGRTERYTWSERTGLNRRPRAVHRISVPSRRFCRGAASMNNLILGRLLQEVVNGLKVWNFKGPDRPNRQLQRLVHRAGCGLVA